MAAAGEKILGFFFQKFDGFSKIFENLTVLEPPAADEKFFEEPPKNLVTMYEGGYLNDHNYISFAYT